MYQTVRYEKKDRIGIATINRPEALNALNSQVIADLEALISEVEKDTELRAFILTGEGRSFVAGADNLGIQGIQRLGTVDGGNPDVVLLLITNGLIHNWVPPSFFGAGPVLSDGYYSKSCANSASRSFCRRGQFPVQIAKKSQVFSTFERGPSPDFGASIHF